MRLRRRLTLLLHPPRDERDLEVCPTCGHSSPRGEGRLVDPVSLRAVCVRCGAEVGKDAR